MSSLLASSTTSTSKPSRRSAPVRARASLIGWGQRLVGVRIMAVADDQRDARALADGFHRLARSQPPWQHPAPVCSTPHARRSPATRCRPAQRRYRSIDGRCEAALKFITVFLGRCLEARGLRRAKASSFFGVVRRLSSNCAQFAAGATNSPLTCLNTSSNREECLQSKAL